MVVSAENHATDALDRSQRAVLLNLSKKQLK